MEVQVCRSHWVETDEVSKQKQSTFIRKDIGAARPTAVVISERQFDAMKTLSDGALHSTMLSQCSVPISADMARDLWPDALVVTCVEFRIT